MEVKFGKTYRDVITGYEGVCIGRCEYMTGCTQVLLATPAKEGAHRESVWLDENRLEWVEDIKDVRLPDDEASPRLAMVGPDLAPPKI